jgi:hypothetical protein
MHGYLLNSENRISDIRNQALCALDNGKQVRDSIDLGELMKT